jgi:hypothetical protein
MRVVASNRSVPPRLCQCAIPIQSPPTRKPSVSYSGSSIDTSATCRPACFRIIRRRSSATRALSASWPCQMRQPLSYPARHRQHPALTVPQDTGPLRLDVGSRTNSPRILAALIGEVRLRSSPPGGGLARGTDREDGFVMRLDFPVLTVTTFAIMRIALLFLLLSAVPAVAGWDVGSFQDRMTDRKETYSGRRFALCRPLERAGIPEDHISRPCGLRHDRGDLPLRQSRR